jgi:hypothetical protein
MSFQNARLVPVSRGHRLLGFLRAHLAPNACRAALLPFAPAI